LLEVSPTVSKKQKTGDWECSDFLPGQDVAAKIGNEWIRAVMIGIDKDHALRLEVEDAEEDEEHPGTKKYMMLK
jgi:hypothetical protein